MSCAPSERVAAVALAAQAVLAARPIRLLTVAPLRREDARYMQAVARAR